MGKTQIQAGDFVKDISFDPPEKGRVLRSDNARTNSFWVKMASGGERSIRAHNLEVLPKKNADESHAAYENAVEDCLAHGETP